jgi:hypothetical protein
LITGYGYDFHKLYRFCELREEVLLLPAAISFLLAHCGEEVFACSVVIHVAERHWGMKIIKMNLTITYWAVFQSHWRQLLSWNL